MKKANGLPGRPKGSTANRPKARPGRPPGACKICEHMRKHKDCGLNRQLIEGATDRSIAKEYGFNEKTVAKHRNKCLTKRLKSAANAREAKAGLDLIACQKEVYDLSIKGAKIALGELKSENAEVKADIRAFGSCLGPATKIVESVYESTIAAKLQEEIDALKEANAKDQ